MVVLAGPEINWGFGGGDWVGASMEERGALWISEPLADR